MKIYFSTETYDSNDDPVEVTIEADFYGPSRSPQLEELLVWSHDPRLDSRAHLIVPTDRQLARFAELAYEEAYEA